MLAVNELIGLDYGGAGAVMTANDFRVQYRQHGKPFRWWKAYPYGEAVEILGPNDEVPENNGHIYVEQELADDVRCMLYQTERNVVDPDFGLIEKGQTGISVLPSEAEFARLDRIAFPDVQWLARYAFTRDGSSTSLPHMPVVAIENVYLWREGQSAVRVPDAEYSANETGLTWLADTTVKDGDICAVEFRFLPMWVWLLNEQGVVQRGADGEALPQRGVITLELGYGEN